MAKPKPIFIARVEDGRLRFEDPGTAAHYIRSLEGKAVLVAVRVFRGIRSIQQNNYWWAVPVELMAEYMGEDRTSTHYALLGECFGYHWNGRLKREVPNKGSSSVLTTEEFSELIEWCPPWALHNFGVRIPLPNECDYDIE